MSRIEFPIMYIPDPTKDRPVFYGKAYFGLPDLDPTIPTNQKQVYYMQENGDKVAISQPISTSAGGIPVYNGSPVTLDISGSYSMAVLDKNLVQVYYIANADSSGASESLITMNEDEQSLLSGQLIVDFDKITVARANIFIGKNSGDRGRLFNVDDYTVTGGSQITLKSSFDAGTKIIAKATELVDPKDISKTINDYGGKGDGISDNTTAYNLAVADINSGIIGLLNFPEGTYLLNPSQTSVITNKSARISGDGRGVSIVKTHIADGVLIDYTRSTGQKTLSISDISLICGVGTASTAIRAGDTSTGVNGGIDCLVLTNVEIETDQGVWWRRQVLMQETGGLVINYAYLRNGGQSAAQNDPLTAIIEIENLNTNVFVIRGIDMSQGYMQRANTMLLLTAEKSIESVYLNSGELVGSDYGIRTEGAGKVGAIKVDVHMDSIKNNILANTNFNFAKIEGDLRLSSNGADLNVNGINCLFNGNVEMMQAIGIVSLESAAVGGTAYSFKGNVIQSKIAPQIRSNASGIRMTGVGIAFGNTLAPSFSSGIINKFIDIPDNMYNETNQLENDTFDGDLDLLFDKVTDDYFRTVVYRLTSGATNLPPGVVAGGSVVVTFGFDGNTGHQVLYPANTGLSFSYVRGYNSGVVSAWGRQGAPLSGVYASPTSITIENGIVTAIS